MATRSSAASRVAPAESISQRRRDAIFMALHECVVERGYAGTNLADVARAAGMSPSHRLYYFPNKAAILAEYFTDRAHRIMARLETLRLEPPERQPDLLADMFFTRKAISRPENGLMLECFGVAVHDRDLRQAKLELDRYCKSCIAEFLGRAGCSPAQARISTELAYALLIGLRMATYFDDKLEPHQAHDMFREELRRLAGYDTRAAKPARTAKSKGRPKGKATARRRAPRASA